MEWSLHPAGDANAAVDSNVKFQVGANGGQTVAVDFETFLSRVVRFQAFSTAATTAAISAQTTASAITTGTAAVNAIDTAITAVNNQRATFGAAVNQLTYAIDNLASVKVNAEASRSRVLDADYTRETSELARTISGRVLRCWRKLTSCRRPCSLCCNKVHG